ncbi:MAG: extracellular solute-binding protein [Clostridia bacterium]
MKKWICVIVGVLIVAMLLVGGWRLLEVRRAPVLTLGLYTGGRWDVPIANSDQFFDTLIRKFEEKHPGVQVAYKSGVLKRDYPEWLASAVLGGKAPDVFLVLPSDFSYLAGIGALEDLTPYMHTDEDFKRDAYFASALKEGVLNGRQLALAYEIAPMLMLVNKTLLDREGVAYPPNDWSLEDFYAICARVTHDTDGDGLSDQFGAYDYTWQEMVYTSGIRLFNELGSEAYFDQIAMTQAITFMKHLESLSDHSKPTSNDFDGGKVAFRPFLFSSYKAYMPYPYRLKKYSHFEWDCLPLPRGDSGNASVLQSSLIAINAAGKDKALAWDFVKLLVCEEAMQEKLLDLSYGIPVLKTIFKRDDSVRLLPSDESINLETILDIVENSVSEPYFREYSTVMKVADREISAIVASQVDIAQALGELNAEIKGML